jgi:uncharacterized protein with FMN-binding domain
LDGDLVRRIVIWLASTVTVVVLLFGYHTSTNSTSTAQGAASSTAPSEPATSPTSPSSSASSRPRSSGTKSYTGDVASTRWGPVQVKITVADGTITKVTVLQSPSGNPRDIEINDRALPILVQDTLDAQSAKIDMVSGATVTSDGYLSSLQSALDAAGI